MYYHHYHQRVYMVDLFRYNRLNQVTKTLFFKIRPSSISYSFLLFHPDFVLTIKDVLLALWCVQCSKTGIRVELCLQNFFKPFPSDPWLSMSKFWLSFGMWFTSSLISIHALVLMEALKGHAFIHFISSNLQWKCGIMKSCKPCIFCAEICNLCSESAMYLKKCGPSHKYAINSLSQENKVSLFQDLEEIIRLSSWENKWN